VARLTKAETALSCNAEWELESRQHVPASVEMPFAFRRPIRTIRRAGMLDIELEVELVYVVAG